MKMLDEDFSYLIDPEETITPAKPKQASAIDTLTQQILASSDPSKWTGEGFGSALANAQDMAKVLSKAGITDINQFGKVQVEVPDVGWVGSTEDGGYEYLGTTHTEDQWGNKATGQAIDPGYDRAGGNVWSGTFAGKGSTGYTVNLDAQGNPHFGASYGGTTGTWSNDIAPALPMLAAIALAAYTGGASLGAVEAAEAALPSLAEAGTTLADLGLESLGASEAMGPTLAELTGSTGPLTGLEQYAAMPEGLGAGGGNVGSPEFVAPEEVQFDYPELDMPEVPQAPEAPQAPAPQEVKFDFPELDMPEVTQAPELPEIAAPQEVKFDYPELDMPEPQVPANDALAADNIDVGGGWNPATGAGDAATAEAAAATGVTESAGLTPAQTYMGNTVEFPSVPEAPVDATANEGSLAKSTSDSGFFDGMSDIQKLAALQAASAIVTKLTTPKMPQAATGFKYESDNKPNYDIKFDDPVHWADIKVPEFKLSDTVTSPYFSQFKTGQAQGPMLNAGNEAYKSALIKGLRDASAMPAFVNPGFVNFATTK